MDNRKTAIGRGARPIIKNRGAQGNPHNRFAAREVLDFDDGWWREEEPLEKIATEVRVDRSKTIVSTNNSPDIPFTQSVNPYKGCEHGCVYCFARPTHEYLDLSLGLDFETKLFYKPNGVELLERFFNKPNYRCQPIALGINTDAYQPLEKSKGLTRRLLQTMLRYKHPVSLVTKGGLILRDLDVLQELAKDDLVSVMVSVTTLDNDLKRIMEPRAASPGMRLKVIRALSERGVNVGVLVAPLIPFINDDELEAIVAACIENGAGSAGYVLLRLPYQIKDLFMEWLDIHYPDRKRRVLNTLRDLYGGDLYRSDWGTRMRGQGAYADLIGQRFALARRKHGLVRDRRWRLRTDLFRVPGRAEQIELWY